MKAEIAKKISILSNDKSIKDQTFEDIIKKIKQASQSGHFSISYSGILKMPISKIIIHLGYHIVWENGITTIKWD